MDLMDALQGIALAAYDRIIGLELVDVCTDGCITKAPCGDQKAGKSPVDREKRGIKRSTMVDDNGILLGVLSASANHHDSPLLGPTLKAFADLPEQASIHLDKAYATLTSPATSGGEGFGRHGLREGRQSPVDGRFEVGG
jgi:hypothetical protein